MLNLKKKTIWLVTFNLEKMLCLDTRVSVHNLSWPSVIHEDDTLKSYNTSHHLAAIITNGGNVRAIEKQ